MDSSISIGFINPSSWGGLKPATGICEAIQQWSGKHFSVKGQTVNSLSSVGHAVSVAAAQRSPNVMRTPSQTPCDHMAWLCANQLWLQ